MEGDKRVFIVVAASALGGLGYFWLNRAAPPSNELPSPPPSELAAPAGTPAPAAPRPLIPLPSLDQSDEFVRARLRALAAIPEAWLSHENLARRLVAAAKIVSEGGSPHDSLSFLRPKKKFPVKRVKGRYYVDPAGYARYDALAEVFASLDAARTAQFVSELGPLFAAACAELDDKRCDFRAAVIRSAKDLLAAPRLEGETRLVEKGALAYAFHDPKLESLSAPQKHLLRMGPANAAKVQDKLRAILAALGAS